jgi:hypothetical protein
LGNIEKTITEDTIHSRLRAKRTAKNSVFLDLFSDKEYLLELYKTLHPDDVNVAKEDLDIVTIENVLTDNLYNDLGLIAHNDKLILLLEAQSTWTENVLVRILMYLAQSYHEYCIKTSQNLYNVKKVKIPKPELYVIYTGERGNKPEVMSLSADFFDGADTSVEVKAKVIYESESDDIINQYIIFSKVFDEQRRKFGYTRETVEETIRICKDRNVLKQYLESKEKEVTTIMMSLFDEEQILTMYVKDKQNEAANVARKEARKEAKKEAKVAAKKMLAKGVSIDDVADFLPQLSYDELRQIEAEVMTLA